MAESTSLYPLCARGGGGRGGGIKYTAVNMQRETGEIQLCDDKEKMIKRHDKYILRNLQYLLVYIILKYEGPLFYSPTLVLTEISYAW